MLVSRRQFRHKNGANFHKLGTKTDLNILKSKRANFQNVGIKTELILKLDGEDFFITVKFRRAG